MIMNEEIKVGIFNSMFISLPTNAWGYHNSSYITKPYYIEIDINKYCFEVPALLLDAVMIAKLLGQDKIVYGFQLHDNLLSYRTSFWKAFYDCGQIFGCFAFKEKGEDKRYFINRNMVLSDTNEVLFYTGYKVSNFNIVTESSLYPEKPTNYKSYIKSIHLQPFCKINPKLLTDLKNSKLGRFIHKEFIPLVIKEKLERVDDLIKAVHNEYESNYIDRTKDNYTNIIFNTYIPHEVLSNRVSCSIILDENVELIIDKKINTLFKRVNTPEYNFDSNVLNEIVEKCIDTKSDWIEHYFRNQIII